MDQQNPWPRACRRRPTGRWRRGRRRDDGGGGGGGIPGLGVPPEGFAISYPAAPVITRDVVVTTRAEFNAAALVAGSRILVQGDITGGDAVIDASDIEVQVADGFTVDRCFIVMENSRIWLNGGSYGEVELQQPIVFFPETAIDEAWFITDVRMEGLDIVTPAAAFAFKVRGRRVAILNCNVTTENYGVWAGDTRLDATILQSEDLIIAHNTIVSTTGAEATLRLLDVLRSAVVDNYLENHSKHNYRVHLSSDQAWCERNVLVDGGTMLAAAAEDTVGTVWFLANELFHQTVAGVFVTSSTHDTYTDLFIERNTLYSDTLTAFPGDPDPSITASGNVVLPAEAPPSPPVR